MMYSKKFIYSPGGENANSNTVSYAEADQKSSLEETAEVKDDKPIIEKIKDALQDWANKDDADQAFDDTRV